MTRVFGLCVAAPLALLKLVETRADAVILYHELIRLAARRDELQALDHKTPEQAQKQTTLNSQHTHSVSGARKYFSQPV